MKNRFAHCIFCDDIFQEEGNKFSFIGVYGPDLFIDQVPTSIPHLCAIATFNTGVAHPVKSLKIIVRLGDQVLQEIEPPASYLEATHQTFVSAADKVQENDTVSYRIQAAVYPVNFDKASVVEVVAIADGEEYIAGRLQVKIAAPQG